MVISNGCNLNHGYFMVYKPTYITGGPDHRRLCPASSADPSTSWHLALEIRRCFFLSKELVTTCYGSIT